MDMAPFKIDLGNLLDSVKTVPSKIDNRILAAVGFAAGSFAAYRALDSISMAGKTEQNWLKKLHEYVRVYWNRGSLIKFRHFFCDNSLFVVNYGSYGIIPRSVLQYKWKMQVSFQCKNQSHK